MPKPQSSILFQLILGLSFALVVWWTWFQVNAAEELILAGQELVRGNAAAAAAAFGAERVEDLVRLGERHRIMFASEGAFFAVVLLLLGWLYGSSVRRESALLLSRDRFLAGATHELKTPLATIVLLLESLRDDRVPHEKRRRYLDNGLIEAERLERGLSNVLTAAGLRATRAAPRPVAGDLAEDVRTAAAAMRERAAAAGITLRLEAPEQLPFVRDPVGMQMVLRNLLDNAIKYSPADSAVDLVLAADGDGVRIDVRDRGRGLDADEQRHVFEPFWRGSENVSGGTGLGLHLVAELVKAHAGSVVATSAGRDRGACFTVRLPRRRA
ncbi:MAG: HAMP domain-containing histidine kinase [Planctomycetes bacterium]|nr:HAMP domain-containing histidine kinase [Planctomycetota bacterium]